MIRIFRALTIGAVCAMCAMFAGCGAQGEPYHSMPVPISKSVIYLYRPYVFYASAVTPVVTCGQESIELESGGYYSFINESGQVTCSGSTAGSSPLKFDAHPGEEYYVKEQVSPTDFSGRTQLTLMPTAVGREEIASCKKQGIPATAAHN